MGCDGGTIPRRDELVRQKKKPEQKDKNAETVAKWKHCALSQNPLHKPIVACELGKLYNKEAVLEHLLNKDKATSEVAGHITKLSDVKELNLTEKPGFADKANQKGDAYVDFHDSRYICPITGVEMNGKQRFYIMWKCRCVLSERAIKEVKSETCHKCGLPFNENDIIMLNGTNEEIEVLREKMVARRHIARLEKKKKKASAAASCAEPSAKKIKVENEESTSSAEEIQIKTKPGTPNGASTSVIDKIKVEPSSSKGVNGISKKEMIDKKNVKGDDLPEKAKKTYSIAKDPSASEAYKSLFTSCSSAKKQGKAHWVTHNPLYY